MKEILFFLRFVFIKFVLGMIWVWRVFVIFIKVYCIGLEVDIFNCVIR